MLQRMTQMQTVAIRSEYVDSSRSTAHPETELSEAGPSLIRATLERAAGEFTVYLIDGKSFTRCRLDAWGPDAIVLRDPNGTILVPIRALSHVRLEWKERYQKGAPSTPRP
jgi:hypothetical protein